MLPEKMGTVEMAAVEFAGVFAAAHHVRMILIKFDERGR